MSSTFEEEEKAQIQIQQKHLAVHASLIIEYRLIVYILSAAAK